MSYSHQHKVTQYRSYSKTVRHSRLHCDGLASMPTVVDGRKAFVRPTREWRRDGETRSSSVDRSSPRRQYASNTRGGYYSRTMRGNQARHTTGSHRSAPANTFNNPCGSAPGFVGLDHLQLLQPEDAPRYGRPVRLEYGGRRNLSQGHFQPRSVITSPRVSPNTGQDRQPAPLSLLKHLSMPPDMVACLSPSLNLTSPPAQENTYHTPAATIAPLNVHHFQPTSTCVTTTVSTPSSSMSTTTTASNTTRSSTATTSISTPNINSQAQTTNGVAPATDDSHNGETSSQKLRSEHVNDAITAVINHGLDDKVVAEETEDVPLQVRRVMDVFERDWEGGESQNDVDGTDTWPFWHSTEEEIARKTALENVSNHNTDNFDSLIKNPVARSLLKNKGKTTTGIFSAISTHINTSASVLSSNTKPSTVNLDALSLTSHSNNNADRYLSTDVDGTPNADNSEMTSNTIAARNFEIDIQLITLKSNVVEHTDTLQTIAKELHMEGLEVKQLEEQLAQRKANFARLEKQRKDLLNDIETKQNSIVSLEKEKSTLLSAYKCTPSADPLSEPQTSSTLPVPSVPQSTECLRPRKLSGGSLNGQQGCRDKPSGNRKRKRKQSSENVKHHVEQEDVKPDISLFHFDTCGENGVKEKLLYDKPK